MAITQALCSSFKQQVLQGDHDLDNDTIKMALYTSTATLDASTTAYSATNEVSSSGTNYTAGGVTLSGGSVTLDGTTAIVDFTDAVFTNVSLTARGALIYNTSSTNTNAAICVLDFGADKTATDGDFTVIFPAAAAGTAIVRIA